MKFANRNLKVFIIAGEVSGDVLGAKIMHKMPGVNFVGIGGKNMESAGLQSLFPMSDLSVMGIVEVLTHAKTLKLRIKQTIDAILYEQPDIVLTIDSPGFARSVVDNVKNSLIYSQKEIVAVSGLEDIILVETEDAIMACKMSESQNVKKLYEKLKAQSSDATKLHKTVFRPWGYYTCLNSSSGYLTKTICVMPKQKLSVQSHNHRSEHWIVLEGKALVLLDGIEHNLTTGDSIDIPLQAKHSLQNPYNEELKILEVQKGDYISEDDIIRYEDCYGRV